jgi:hypothetical protein
MGMPVEPSNLVPEQLRLIRADIADVKSGLGTQISDLADRVENIDAQLQGLTYVMTTAIGSIVIDVKDMKQRIETLESA